MKHAGKKDNRSLDSEVLIYHLLRTGRLLYPGAELGGTRLHCVGIFPDAIIDSISSTDTQSVLSVAPSIPRQSLYHDIPEKQVVSLVDHQS